MNEAAKSSPAWLGGVITITGAACVVLLAWWALTPPAGNSSGFAPRIVSPCVMDRDGYLKGAIFGVIQRELDWRGSEMRCDGMFRPEGNGIRLVFNEHLDEDKPGLLILIGIADAVIGEPASELPINITVIDQERSLFFASPDATRCWTTLDEQLLLTGTVEEMWRINGHLYCAGALPALTGSGTVTLGDIEFSGVFKPNAN